MWYRTISCLSPFDISSNKPVKVLGTLKIRLPHQPYHWYQSDNHCLQDIKCVHVDDSKLGEMSKSYLNALSWASFQFISFRGTIRPIHEDVHKDLQTTGFDSTSSKLVGWLQNVGVYMEDMLQDTWVPKVKMAWQRDIMTRPDWWLVQSTMDIWDFCSCLLWHSNLFWIVQDQNSCMACHVYWRVFVRHRQGFGVLYQNGKGHPYVSLLDSRNSGFAKVASFETFWLLWCTVFFRGDWSQRCRARDAFKGTTGFGAWKTSNKWPC